MADEMNVDELLLGLASLGFELEDCQLAVEAGNNTLESAVEWLITKRSNADLEISLPTTRAGVVESEVLKQDPSTSRENQEQPSSSLSSRYIISKEHQKAKKLFMEKERETARMEAKRRKLMDKMARKEVLQQIEEDRKNRLRRNQPTAPHVASTEKPSIKLGAAQESHEKHCLLQIRGPSGTVKRELFSPEATLQDVVSFASNQYQLKSEELQLLQPFPHRVFTVAEMTSTLVELGLSPGGSLVVRKMATQISTSPDHKSSILHPDSEAAVQTDTETSDTLSAPPPADGNSLPVDSDDRNDSDEHGNDNDVSGDQDDQPQDVAHPVFNRSPPPELEEDLAAPLQGLDPNVLGVGGAQMFAERHQCHVWGEGMRLGEVEHNPHTAAPLPRVQNPRVSAERRLEMHHFQQLGSKAGCSQISTVEHPHLHREVPCLRDLCINHISNRLPGHENPINSLGVLPHDLCDKILSLLMKNKTLTPKSIQAFLSCGLRHVKLDCYLLVTNELLTALRLHKHLNHLSLRSCTLITDKALEAITVLKRLKSLNLSQCPQLTDKCFVHIKELLSLTTLCMDMTKITDRGVCYFLRNAACCPNILHLSLRGCSITDESLQAMSVLKALKILDIGRTGVTVLDVAQHLQQLESLNVSHTGIQDDSLLHVSYHPSLVSLSLLSTAISDNGLCYLQGLHLSQLKLPDRLNITDKGVINIQTLPLLSLDLSDYIHITDDGVHSIACMTRLTQLSLSNTKLTDEGMRCLSALIALEELNVDRTVITDKGCAVLSSLHNLRILGLSSTRISNRLLISGALNSCKKLARLNLCRTRISNKGLHHVVLPSLNQLNLDWTRVTTDCRSLLTGCPALNALRTRNCTPPSQASDDSDEEQNSSFMS